MAMTVITVSNAPRSLRGDLTKWMQEIATGVYIGDLNSRVREQLWERVIQSVGRGQATLCYSANNELGYQFTTHRTQQINISFDGIPLVMIPQKEKYGSNEQQLGFSNQAKFRQARKYTAKKSEIASVTPYVVIDVETTGLNPITDDIIEIAAIKVEPGNYKEFQSLISINRKLPTEIAELTGITNRLLIEKGQDISKALDDFTRFIEDLPIVGYNLLFDIKFIDHNLLNIKMDTIKNRKIDLMGLVKREKMFLKSYKLEDVLVEYGVDGFISHRALKDARLTHGLSSKVNGFARQLKRKR